MNSRRPTAWIPPILALGIVAGIAGWLSGCATPPRDPEDVCAIFSQRHSWYRATQHAQQRWGIDQAIQMAVIFQESSFRAGARPPRTRLLGLIPWRRSSSAYGYAQVLNNTWELYRRSAVRPRAERDRFPDAADFVAWYLDRIVTHTEIEKSAAFALYLAYHEGAGGYRRGTHLDKPWLLDAARRVEQRTARYRAQLEGCRERLERHRWWWPF